MLSAEDVESALSLSSDDDGKVIRTRTGAITSPAAAFQSGVVPVRMITEVCMTLPSA